MFGPFYRIYDGPDVIRKVIQSGELWGRAATGIFRTDFPKVKAYKGHLPKGLIGFEFETDVEPDLGSVPSKPVWSNWRPGVAVEGEYANIKVRIINQNVLE